MQLITSTKYSFLHGMYYLCSSGLLPVPEIMEEYADTRTGSASLSLTLTVLEVRLVLLAAEEYRRFVSVIFYFCSNLVFLKVHKRGDSRGGGGNDIYSSGYLSYCTIYDI